MKHIRYSVLAAIGAATLIATGIVAGVAPVGAGAASASGTNPLAALEALPISIALPITAIDNVIAGTAIPNQDSTSGTNVTTQSSPLANVSAPVNVCSVSAGILANAKSSCSTTSVGVKQLGAIANVNVPITAQDNAIGLLGQASTALGLNT